MDIIKYLNINYSKNYTTIELNNIFSKFNNLNTKNYYMNEYVIGLLSRQHFSTIIKFINMFKDINEFEALHNNETEKYSLVGNILFVIVNMNKNEISVYKIMDHLLKLNMDIEILGASTEDNKVYDIEFYTMNMYCSVQNYFMVLYMVCNFDIIQNVRKIINNYDILLFDIIDDLQFIKQILLITKSKHKNLPKYIITHKILYYYLLDKNEINNI